MATKLPFTRTLALTAATGILALGLFASSTSIAVAATVIDGPIDLGAASTFGVLGATSVTNDGLTVVNGDVGVFPGTSITGFEGPPAGLVNGTVHAADSVAGDAQNDLTAAIVDAAGLTPTTSGLGNLSGLSLTPGVYAGGELSLNSGGLLTLAGTADSIWVFQAASKLTIGSTARIQITGGATSCNVFWQIGSSATIDTDAAFVGTVLASQAITLSPGASVEGRLLADNAEVTLLSDLITTPTGCAPGTEPVETDSPEFTSSTPPAGTVGAPYSHTVTASGTPTPTYTVTNGTLPAGLALDSATGVISGIPVTSGPSTVTITAANGTTPVVSTIVTITIAAAPVVPPAVDTPTAEAPPAEELPPTGSAAATGLSAAAILFTVGLALLTIRRARRAH